jgi:hypothetical protein
MRIKVSMTILLFIFLLMTVAISVRGNENEYSDEDFYVLSHIIQEEAGYCSKEMMEGVGSVILNRVTDSRFPDTIPEVVYQRGQYTSAEVLAKHTPTKTAKAVTKDLLRNGSKFPKTVVWQANFPQGRGIYKTISTSYSTMYFCY